MESKSIEFKAIIDKKIKESNDFRMYAVTPTTNADILKFNKYGNVSINGNLMELTLGMEYLIKVIENKYGYEVVKIKRDKPTTKQQTISFLSEVITKKQAETLLKVYPNIVEQVISGDIKDIDLEKTKGIKLKTFEVIKRKIVENFPLIDFIEEFGEYGITLSMAKKMHDTFSSVERMREKMTNNPYEALCMISGIGFKKADSMILSVASNKHLLSSITRINSCIKFCLEENQSEGNTWIALLDLYNKCDELVPESIDHFIDALVDNKIYVDNANRRVSFEISYKTEAYIAEKLLEILNNSKKLQIEYSKYFRINGIELSEEQQGVLKNFCQYNLSLLVGSAGSGKSFCTQSIIKLCDDNKLSYILMTPTGKSAMVLSEYTNRDAGTIHRKLEYKPGEGWGYNEDNKLSCNVVIVDENGMTDIFLMKHLLEAIDTNKTRLLFVQDANQLPSVQCGNCAYDMINSNIIPATTLTKTFRFGEGGLLNVATKIVHGEKYIDNSCEEITTFGTKSDYSLIPVDDDVLLDYTIGIYKRLMDMGNSPLDILVLSAKNVHANGTIELNKSLQEKFNPHKDDKPYVIFGDNVYRIGDIVMQCNNNYKAINDEDNEVTVTNGDIGKIIDIRWNNIYIQYQRNIIVYDKGDLDQICLAYCISIHKCITDDTWLYTSKGLKQLKELNNGALVGEFKNIDYDIKVFNGTYMEKPLKFYNDGVSDCKYITTKRAYNLTATLNHKVDVLGENGYMQQKYIKDLTYNDFLFIRKNANIFGDNIILPNEWSIHCSNDVRTKIHKRPTIMSKELARFLGYMVADGTIAKSAIKFSKRYKEVVEDFQNIVHKLFGYCKDSIKLRPSGDYMYEVCSKDIVDFCKNIKGIQPNYKFVPNCILESPKEYQCEFLKTLFEDGTVNLKREAFDHIELSMKEQLLNEQVRMMLLNMGIITTYDKRIKSNKKSISTSHLIYIYKKDARIFTNNIGFISDFKVNRLKKCFIELKDNDRESIPYINKIMDKLIKTFGLIIQNKNIINSIREGRITFSCLNKFLCEVRCQMNMTENPDFSYLQLIYDNYFIDKIKAIDDRVQHTYCLEMPETHKFIQNGISAWNSQGSGIKNVILVTPVSHKWNLNKNLMYVGITRAKEKCFHLSLPSTINFAIKKSAELNRNTFLMDLLKIKNN